MNILAIDFGTKNIGLAWCDTDIGIVLPYGIIKNQNLDELSQLIKKENIDQVIIGLPLGLNNEENINTKRVREFGDRLKSLVNIKIDFFDERFSSAQADRTEGGVSRDEKAAMVILEDYLASKK